MATLEQLLTERIPPHDSAAERAVLGGVLLDREAGFAKACAVLTAEDFFHERHRNLWRACLDLVGNELGLDTVTACQRLAEIEEAPIVTLRTWCAELLDETATLTNLEGYVRAVKRASLRRSVIRLATQAVSRAYEDVSTDPLTITADVVRGFEQLTGQASEAELPPTVSTLGEALDRVMESLAQPGPGPTVRTPFPGINRRLGGGFFPGELVFLGARPGVGKTAIALEIARAAGARGEGVLIVSREMVVDALARRILAQASGVAALSLRTGRVEGGEVALLRYALPSLRRLPVWLTDQALTLEQIRRLVREPGPMRPRLLVVDYLQLVRAPREIRERRLQVEAVSQGLKALALDAGIPVLCLSSLARAEAGARDRRPTMQDLRESGELEHDADVILLLHRAPMQAEAECIIAKARDAETAIVPLTFHGRTVHFTEDAERSEG